jgi:hypothetical protein
MSLTALLDKLTALLPKYFIIGAFVPVLIFGFLNSILLYQCSETFRDWVRSQGLTKSTLFTSTAILVGLAVVAYLLSALNVFMREILEGKHIANTRLNDYLESLQRKNVSKLEDEYRDARDQGLQISGNKAAWQDAMVAAAQKGLTTGANNYDGSSSTAAKELIGLRDKRAKAQTIGPTEISHAVNALNSELSTNNIKLAHQNGVPTLSRDRADLLNLMDYAIDAWSAREIRAFNRRNRFGIDEIAATRLGNVAQSIQAYGITRYGLNTDTFWARLQPIIASKNADFYKGIQDAKTQLDFLVACFWLAILSTAWLVPLFFMTTNIVLFFMIAIGCPGAAWLCYALAVESYVVFAELVRTSIDLYRFNLLQALRITMPNGVRAERELWLNLQRLSTYGQEWVEFSYDSDSRGTSS